jgi:hypothetical protein
MPPNAIDALRRVKLDWTVVMRDVWRDQECDVPDIHQDVRSEFAAELDRLASSTAQASPAGWVITGAGGAGKTHLLGQFRAECFRRKICFILVDMTDVHDFWDTVLLGYFTSLQEPIEPDRTQFRLLMDRLLMQIKLKEPHEVVARKLVALPPEKLRGPLDKLLGALNGKFPAQIGLHADVVRAVLAINSMDYALVNIANAWLQGEEVDAESKQLLRLTRSREKSSSIVRGLSWLMSLGGASVVALDQLDPIVTQLDLEREALGAAAALAIINKLAAGMSELRDVTQRTLVTVSCVEFTWRQLKKNTPTRFMDRYREPKVLPPLISEKAMETLVAERMKQALQGANFAAPYPSWPFKAEWLKKENLGFPREILQKCQAHLEECVRRGQVKELPPGWETAGPNPPKPIRFAEIDAKFDQLRSAAQIGPILDEEQEDKLLGPLLRSALRCVKREWKLPEETDVILDEIFTGGAAMKPLHARLRLVFHKENSREEHFCIRAMQKSNARAFATRLRSAITQSGIDKALKFRRLSIVRQSSYPAGDVTSRLLKQFEDYGGARVVPLEEDIRTLDALQTLDKAPPDGFSDWLKARQHASKTKFVQAAIPGFFSLVSSVSKEPAATHSMPAPISPTLFPTVGGNNNGTTPTANSPTRPPPAAALKPTPPNTAALSNGQLLLGRRLIGEKPSTQPTTIPLAALRKHAVVFAGAGSGKTVLLKRLIEGIALLGVPAIVIDCANDLAAIGDPWPSPPEAWRDGDAELARQFFQTTERIVWTPGKESGNALGLEPLPDLADLVSSPEELQEAIIMSVEALSPVIAMGTRPTVAKKQALLHKAFRFLAENGNCNLPGLAAVLRDLPPQVSAGIGDERKLAAAMADDLNAQLAINPLLCSSGPVLDPAELLGGHGKTRISVISFIGLPTQEAQQQFINQLAMTLFTWIKRNPAPPAMALRGILVIDEARDFVPSQKSTPCLGSMQRLAAQARKYGLGLILATQNPRDLDNKIVGQCSTQWYGKMNSPIAIDAALDLLRSRGGSSGDDVGALKTGRFYVSNADHLTPPARLETPMCLSSHVGPMEQELILEKARACRTRLATSQAR